MFIKLTKISGVNKVEQAYVISLKNIYEIHSNKDSFSTITKQDGQTVHIKESVDRVFDLLSAKL